MSTSDKARKLIEKLPPRIASVVIGSAGRIPKVRTLLEAEYETMLDAAPVVRPRADVPVYSRLPENGRDRDDLIADVSRLAEAEHREWSDGYASGAVYHGDSEHIDFLNQVYSLQS
ncbi:MAG: aspartate aminotransferase family protein, partial [Acidimicrobiia bacterium]